MTFNTEIIGCYWNEETGQWTVKLKQSSGSVVKQFEETCDLLLHATGILNNFKWPDIKGLDSFKGKVIRTFITRSCLPAQANKTRYRQMARRLPRRPVETGISSHYRLRSILCTGLAHHATSCKAHRRIRSYCNMVRLSCRK
jgi:hypothetical protein